MIRLVALACGVLCGIGTLALGLFRPSLLWDLAAPGGDFDPSLGIGLLSALGVSLLTLALTRRLRLPLLGGEVEPVEVEQGWRAVTGGLLFGLGWGVTGYYPLGALVAIGLLAPGAVIFLSGLLAGMFVHDLLTGRGGTSRYLG